MSFIRTAFIPLLLAAASCQAQSADSAYTRTVLVAHEYNGFRQASRSQWHQSTVEYRQQGRSGTYVGRLNYGQRFGSQGWQAEVEAYPRISKKVYGYAALGYSPDAPVFASWRSGASLFVNLPGGWELEGGGRYLRFQNDIWMLTSGISKYLGNWLVQGRGFCSVNNPQGNDQSFFLSTRYYLPNGIDYLWVQAGTGISPDESQAAQLQLPNLRRRMVQGGFRKTLGCRHLLQATLGYARNEYRKNTYGSQLTLQAGYGLKF